MRVLIIDDEPMMRTYLSHNLINSCNVPSWNIVEVDNGTEGMHQLTVGGSFDVIFLDILMPGINGKDTLNKILFVNPMAKVIMYSSSSVDEDECLKAGAKAFLHKPATPESIQKALEKIK